MKADPSSSMHSPTPWKVKYGREIVDRNDRTILDTGAGVPIDEGTMRANAKLIVDAVNKLTAQNQDEVGSRSPSRTASHDNNA
jgi:NADPH-dependent glutamate synthase beta subunit-like oxidoreductase